MWKSSVLLLVGSLHAGSLMLTNDSPFPLVAEVYNAAGDQRAAIRLAVGQTYVWYDNDSSFKKQYDKVTTPYSVRFLCPRSRAYDYSTTTSSSKKGPKKPTYQSEFGTWSNVPTGALVNALGSDGGPKSCVIKDKAKRDQKAASKAYKNDGFTTWENDGGETWTNDSTPGWENNDVID